MAGLTGPRFLVHLICPPQLVGMGTGSATPPRPNRAAGVRPNPARTLFFGLWSIATALGMAPVVVCITVPLMTTA